MFVGGNGFSDIKQYFKAKLSHLYSDNEIKNVLKSLTIKRFNISNLEYVTFSTKLSESDLLYYHFALKRILNNEPVQYILGSVEFYGLELEVGPGVLIPRPETEELVDWIVQSHKTVSSIVDICTGSGCIAFGLEKGVMNASIQGLEFSDDALLMANKNKVRLNSNVLFKKFDALSLNAYKDLSGTQLWVSNPPYIPDSDKNLMADNVLNFEPHLALFVEDGDPLIFYRVIASNAKDCLADDGWLYFEIHEEYGGEVKSLLSSLGFVNIELRKDLQGRDRMIRAQKVL